MRAAGVQAVNTPRHPLLLCAVYDFGAELPPPLWRRAVTSGRGVKGATAFLSQNWPSLLGLSNTFRNANLASSDEYKGRANPRSAVLISAEYASVGDVPGTPTTVRLIASTASVDICAWTASNVRMQNVRQISEPGRVVLILADLFPERICTGVCTYNSCGRIYRTVSPAAKSAARWSLADALQALSIPPPPLLERGGGECDPPPPSAPPEEAEEEGGEGEIKYLSVAAPSLRRRAATRPKACPNMSTGGEVRGSALPPTVASVPLNASEGSLLESPSNAASATNTRLTRRGARGDDGATDSVCACKQSRRSQSQCPRDRQKRCGCVTESALNERGKKAGQRRR